MEQETYVKAKKLQGLISEKKAEISLLSKTGFRDLMFVCRSNGGEERVFPDKETSAKIHDMLIQAFEKKVADLEKQFLEL